MGEAVRPRFPWAQIMQIGLGELRLAPHEFWAMTLKELAAAAHAMPGAITTAPHRARLDELMTRYPDGGTADGTD